MEEEIKGAVKQVVGKVIGDAKLESEGRADKVEGKVQNAIGGLKGRQRLHVQNVAAGYRASKGHR